MSRRKFGTDHGCPEERTQPDHGYGQTSPSGIGGQSWIFVVCGLVILSIPFHVDSSLRVMATSSQGPAVLSVVEIPRDHQGVLRPSSLSTSPVHRGFSWRIDELAGDIFGRDVCVIEEGGFPWLYGHANSCGCITNSPQVVYYEDVSWCRKRFRAYELLSHGGRRLGASGDRPNRVPSTL